MNQYNWPVIVVVVQLEYVRLSVLRLPVVVYINYVSVCVLVCLSTGYVLLLAVSSTCPVLARRRLPPLVCIFITRSTSQL